MSNQLKSSELVLNQHNRVYHLDLAPEDIAQKIILVGDPGRVSTVSSFFDTITVKRENREFVTHTGLFKDEPISVLSTGIGTDNIDIVMNELDALVGINLENREIKDGNSLILLRLGTSGAIHQDAGLNDVVAGAMALGLDNVPAFYKGMNAVREAAAEMLFYEKARWEKHLPAVYFVNADPDLLYALGKSHKQGITVTAPGFYGPQGRALRLPLSAPDINERLAGFRYKNLAVTNYEMESSALYALAAMMGHKALTLCKIIANRVTKSYNPDYKEEMKALIQSALEGLRNYRLK